MDTQFSRREFLQTLAGAAGVVLVGSGCSNDGSGAKPQKKAQLAIKNSDGTFLVKGGGKLKPGTGLGFLLPAPAPSGEPLPTLIFVTQKGELRALSARCTHASCPVTWDRDSNNSAFLCPCHGSRFDTNGAVLNGPATEPLTSYPARKKGEDAIITVKT